MLNVCDRHILYFAGLFNGIDLIECCIFLAASHQKVRGLKLKLREEYKMYVSLNQRESFAPIQLNKNG